MGICTLHWETDMPQLFGGPHKGWREQRVPSHRCGDTHRLSRYRNGTSFLVCMPFWLSSSPPSLRFWWRQLTIQYGATIYGTPAHGWGVYTSSVSSMKLQWPNSRPAVHGGCSTKRLRSATSQTGYWATMTSKHSRPHNCGGASGTWQLAKDLRWPVWDYLSWSGYTIIVCTTLVLSRNCVTLKNNSHRHYSCYIIHLQCFCVIKLTKHGLQYYCDFEITVLT